MYNCHDLARMSTQSQWDSQVTSVYLSVQCQTHTGADSTNGSLEIKGCSKTCKPPGASTSCVNPETVVTPTA